MVRIARLATPWGLLFAAGMFIRGLFDTFSPPSPNGYGPRSAVTTWFAVGMFFLAGLAGTYRTRQAGSAPLVAATASVIGNSLAVVAALVLFLTVIRHDAQMLRNFEMTGGWDETLFLPIVTLPIVAAVGLVGGLFWLGLSSAFSHLRARLLN
jgi:hypothetical protein